MAKINPRLLSRGRQTIRRLKARLATPRMREWTQSRRMPSTTRLEKVADNIALNAYAKYEEAGRARVIEMAGRSVDSYAIHVAARQALDRFAVRENRGKITELLEKIEQRINERINRDSITRANDVFRDTRILNWSAELQALLGKKTRKVLAFHAKKKEAIERRLKPAVQRSLQSHESMHRFMDGLFGVRKGPTDNQR